jgi:hypothetical protein
MLILCECNSANCRLKIEIPAEEYSLKENHEIIIVNNCKIGPEPTDILIKEKNGYKIYRENSV